MVACLIHILQYLDCTAYTSGRSSETRRNVMERRFLTRRNVMEKRFLTRRNVIAYLYSKSVFGIISPCS